MSVSKERVEISSAAGLSLAAGIIIVIGSLVSSFWHMAFFPQMGSGMMNQDMMNSIMDDPELRQQMMDMMMNNPQMMQSMMQNQQFMQQLNP